MGIRKGKVKSGRLRQRKRTSLSKNTRTSYRRAYHHGYKAGFAKGLEDGHQHIYMNPKLPLKFIPTTQQHPYYSINSK